MTIGYEYQMLHTRFLYHMGTTVILSCDIDHLYNLLFPFHKETLQTGKEFRKLCFDLSMKMTIDRTQ